MKTKKAVVGSIFGMVIATIVIIIVLLLFIVSSVLVKSFYSISATTGFKSKDSGQGQELGKFYNELNNAQIFDFVLNCEADVNGNKVLGKEFLFEWKGDAGEMNAFASSCAEKIPYFETRNGAAVFWYNKGKLSNDVDFPEVMRQGGSFPLIFMQISEYNIGENKMRLSYIDVYGIFRVGDEDVPAALGNPYN